MKYNNIHFATKQMFLIEKFIPQIVELYKKDFDYEDYMKLMRDVSKFVYTNGYRYADNLIEFMQRNIDNKTLGSNSFYDAFCDIDYISEELVTDGFSESFINELLFDIDRLITQNRPK